MTSRRDEHAEVTRSAIVDAATALFGERGYADTALEAIASAARVTTGAIYHHFGGKQALFETVAERAEQRILDAVMASSSKHDDPWDQMMAGFDALLGEASQPAIHKIVFLDAPAVVGPVRWREIEARYAFGLLRGGLARLNDAGLTKPLNPEYAAAIMLGALIEAATAVATAVDRPAAHRESLRVLEALAGGLRI